MVRAGGVLTGGDDGEVDLVVTLFEDSSAEMGGHFRLGSPHERDLAALQFAGDPVDGSACCGQGGDLRRILGHPQRTDHVDGSGVGRTAKLWQQLDEEAGPHLVAHCDPTRSGGQPGDDRRGVLRLTPRQEIEHSREFANPRGLERRNHHRGSGIARDDEHRQPLERHGGVSREVRQVVADRQQQRVDPLLGHRPTHSGETFQIDGRVDNGSAHRHSVPASTPLRPAIPRRTPERAVFAREFGWSVPAKLSRKRLGARSLGKRSRE